MCWSSVLRLWEYQLSWCCEYPIFQQTYRNNSCEYTVPIEDQKKTTTDILIRWRYSKVVIIYWVNTDTFDGLVSNALPSLTAAGTVVNTVVNIQMLNILTYAGDNQRVSLIHSRDQPTSYDLSHHKMSWQALVQSADQTLLSLSHKLSRFHHSCWSRTCQGFHPDWTRWLIPAWSGAHINICHLLPRMGKNI